MKAVVQRVSQASVRVQEAGGGWTETGRIGMGYAVLLGVANGDSSADATWMAGKLSGLRLFEDETGRMNLDLRAVGGAVLMVSQFTLLGDARKGRRPAFTEAMAPEPAQALYAETCRRLRESGLVVAEGRFRATMRVEVVNEGPVTLLLDSRAGDRTDAR